MKQIAFIALVITLFFSQFNLFGASVSNNTIALALMILLMVLFSDLAEFDFWGIRGKRKESELKELVGKEVVAGDASKPPSTYKIRQAEKEDSPIMLASGRENLLSISYEIERLLRVILRSQSRGKLDLNELNPAQVLSQIKEKGLLTDSAYVSIEKIREVRSQLVEDGGKQLTTQVLEATQQLAIDIYLELKDWLAK